ncbi:hypothetical protein H4Q32_014237 [Labeo rohita]|uniref:DIX domain-containing protein n=1 Tax=Labeo rohita TaxID=84645 RepID=A0ABQ8LTA4_LABRO|nr:hypothetical protein H4Q32_014237 [Labeo rohita]
MAETKIIYHLDEQETPYLIKLPIPAENVTLADFKNVLNKPNYKFFFKSMDDDFGSAAVIPVFMSGKVHFSAVAHLPAHAAEVWNADLETPDHSGIMLTDPLSRFPQSLLSHKEQCQVAKFKSMRSAFCLLFLACRWFSFRRQATQTSSCTHHLQNRTLLTHFFCPRCLFVSVYCPNQLIKVNSQPLFRTLWHNHFQTLRCHAMMQNRPA